MKSDLIFAAGGFKTFSPPESKDSKCAGSATFYHGKTKFIVLLKDIKVYGSDKPIPAVALAESPTK